MSACKWCGEEQLLWDVLWDGTITHVCSPERVAARFYEAGVEAAARAIEEHSCVATCCDAEGRSLAACVRRSVIGACRCGHGLRAHEDNDHTGGPCCAMGCACQEYGRAVPALNVLRQAIAGLAPSRPAAERARLDADRTAEPKTKLVAHVPAGERIVGHSKVIDYELRDTPSAPVPEQDDERAYAEPRFPGTSGTLANFPELASNEERAIDAICAWAVEACRFIDDGITKCDLPSGCNARATEFSEYHGERRCAEHPTKHTTAGNFTGEDEHEERARALVDRAPAHIAHAARGGLTYIHDDEPGTTLRAAGWVPGGPTDGGEWTRPSRKRKKAADADPKIRWWAPWSKVVLEAKKAEELRRGGSAA